VRFRPWSATMLLATCVVACSSYHTIADPATSLQPSPAHSVRVTRQDGSRFMLEAAFVSGDSLRGHTLNGRTVALALTEVAAVERSKTNVVATVAVAAGATALFGAVSFIATFNSANWSVSE